MGLLIHLTSGVSGEKKKVHKMQVCVMKKEEKEVAENPQLLKAENERVAAWILGMGSKLNFAPDPLPRFTTLKNMAENGKLLMC